MSQKAEQDVARVKLLTQEVERVKIDAKAA